MIAPHKNNIIKSKFMQWVIYKKIGKVKRKLVNAVQKQNLLPKIVNTTKNDNENARHKNIAISKRPKTSKKPKKIIAESVKNTAKKRELSLLKKYDFTIKNTDKNSKPKENQFWLKNLLKNSITKYATKIVEKQMSKFRSFFIRLVFANWTVLFYHSKSHNNLIGSQFIFVSVFDFILNHKIYQKCYANSKNDCTDKNADFDTS